MSSTPFDRQISFALFSAENPTVPHSGVDLDAEFNAVKVALDDTQQNLALIQDDDGVLKRGSVGQAQFDSSVSLGFGPPATWETGRVYTADVDTVFEANRFYITNTTHTSGVSFDVTKFDLLADFTASAVISDGSITSAKLADAAVDADKIADGSISNPKLASQAVTTTKLADAAVTFSKLASDASQIIPAGLGPLPFSGTTLPAGWDWADGGVLLSSTAYPTLRAQLIADNFPYGQDGSGNPKKPDARERVIAGFGRPTGGASPGRLTSAGSGVDGSTLGAVGGAQTHTLTEAQLAVHDHDNALSDPGHFHSDGSTVTAATGLDVSARGISGSDNNTGNSFSGVNITNASAGSGAAHNNVQPTLVCNMIIKAH